jgi:hypothetical protein
MTAVFTNKGIKGGRRRRYYYYRCTTIGHKGWGSCSTKQIGADRFHDTVQRNLHRISMDPDYLENLLLKVKNQTQSVNSTGYEPLQPNGDFTVQNVQNHLKGILRISARKPGIEKSLAVRGHIQEIRYSKERVCVDVRMGRPTVGESSFGQTSSAATLSAVPSSFSSPEIRKGPVRISQTDPFPQFVGFVNGGVDGI